MSFTIENLTEKPLWLRLNSGASLAVMPQSSSQVADSEVADNAKLERLAAQRLIRMTRSEGEGEPESEPGHAGRGEARRTHRRNS
jgi:hypothetical protein